MNTISLPEDYHLTCEASGCSRKADYQQFKTETDGLGTVRCPDHLLVDVLVDGASRQAAVVERWQGSAAGDGKRGFGRVIEVDNQRLRIDDSERRQGLPVAY